MLNGQDQPEAAEPELAEQAGRTVRAALGSWPATIRLGVLGLFAAGSFAVYYLVAHASSQEPPQCQVDVVVHEPAKVGGQQRA